MVTGCGGGSGAGGPAAEGVGEFTAECDGPEVTLPYRNCFTGADGPFMTELVDQFKAEHDNIKIESNTIQWADLYERVPAGLQAGKGRTSA